MGSSSPFLSPGTITSPSTLALLALRRDQFIPAVLREASDSDPTDEITNTRFGCFPHSTLLNLPWGSQVVASNVNARESKRGKKRKRPTTSSTRPSSEGTPAAGPAVDVDADADADAEDGHDGGNEQWLRPPAFEAASSGFAHVLPPTPELWTLSLPHRTQIVYTPDYSYILQRLRVRPGSRVIEAGAGSGSFTHAAARAVFNGYPVGSSMMGKVFSFEYHEPRYMDLKKEIRLHGLDGVVEVTHRDVYQDGFLIDDKNAEVKASGQGEPQADAVFLDLPAPWMALPHLTRHPPDSSPSPLNPSASIYICTFSPCIEQAQRTVSTLRDLGWLSISMSDMVHKQIIVRRERVGLQEEGLRGVNASAASVEEALGRLRQLDTKMIDYHDRRKKVSEDSKARSNEDGTPMEEDDEEYVDVKVGPVSRKQRLDSNKNALNERKLWKEGRLVHRTEPELKTHTSYLVFALLPREWSDKEEKICEAQWPIGHKKS